MENKVNKNINQQEAIAVIDRYINNPILNGEAHEILRKLKKCLQYEIDHKTFVWFNPPEELGDDFISKNELSSFFNFTWADNYDFECFLSVDFSKNFSKIWTNINDESEGYNVWGTESAEDAWRVVDVGTPLEVKRKYAIDKSVFDELNKPVEILFPQNLVKAQTKNGNFIEGYLDFTEPTLNVVKYKKELHKGELIITVVGYCEIIDKSTICRCLGFKDINGKLVFDNHYVKHYNSKNGKEDKSTFEIGRIFFDENTLSWKRTIEYVQENGNEVVITRIPNVGIPSVQMSPQNDYELLGDVFNNSIENFK